LGYEYAKKGFLYIDDMSTASVFLMQLDMAIYDPHTEPMKSHINISYVEDISIAELSHAVAKVTKYQGKITFDAGKPDGSP